MIKSLKSKISSYLRVPESIPPHFVPVKELISTIDTSVIQGLIAELVGPGERTSFADDGFISQSLTTLLIFLSIDEEAEFIPLLRTGWTDQCLPMPSQTSLQSFSLGLSSDKHTKFERAQWSFLSPEFTQRDAHLDLDERAVLPYLEVQETAVKRGDCSDVTISCIKIHPLYQSLYKPCGIWRRTPGGGTIISCYHMRTQRSRPFGKTRTHLSPISIFWHGRCDR